MKIEKLPSGSYRIRKMYQGTTYTIVFNHKPTQKEAMKAMADELEKVRVEGSDRLTFRGAAEQYLSVKSNVISPSTIRGYNSILRALSNDFLGKSINRITGIDIQKEINAYSVGRSPKTVRNVHGFISAVLSMFRPDMNIYTTLPQKRKIKQYIPSDEDIKKLLQYVAGSSYEIPFILATFGLRRSEICALTPEDINQNTLTINKAMVQGPDRKYVIKVTKTTEGARSIYIPDYLVNLIHEKGMIYDGCPHTLLKYLHKAQDKLNIPRFRLHDMRHYYASMSHSLGIPDSYIMQAGGWKSDATLKSVYRHAMEDKKIEMQEFAAQYITELCENP